MTSAKVTVAGTCFFGSKSLVNSSNRASGTVETPICASVRENFEVEAGAVPWVINWNRVVFPAVGSPMSPARNVPMGVQYRSRTRIF